jgi:ATP-dependent DNA helicase RecQ
LFRNYVVRQATRLNLPFAVVLACSQEIPEQKTMANSAMQARNIMSGVVACDSMLPGPVLLVDDIIDSGWTMAWAASLLRINGSGIVHPFALARTAMRRS